MQQFTLAAHRSGLPTRDDFREEEGPRPRPASGEFGFRTLWLSIDPYQRGAMNDLDPGTTMEGGCVVEVTESRHPGYRAGDIVVGAFGWVTHGVSDGRDVRTLDPAAAPIFPYVARSRLAPSAPTSRRRSSGCGR